MIKHFGIVLAMSIGVAGSDQPQLIFHYEIKSIQLENGLRVVAVPFDSPGIVAYYTVVRTGSRNEVEPGKSGFAHFFEHMMFRGTEKFSAEAFNKEMVRLGADFNAFTDDDWTCYTNVVPAAGLEKIIELEADRFQNLKYTEDAFKIEAGAILGEYGKSASNPFLLIYEKMAELAFQKHTYGHTTIGYLKDIQDMPNQYAYSLEFYDRWYRPENCVVVVVGDFDMKALDDAVRRHYGSWTRRDFKVDIPVEAEQKTARREELTWPGPTLPVIMTGYKIPSFSTRDKEYAALDILGSYYFGETSEVYQDLVVRRQLAESLSFINADRRDPNLFYIHARLKNAGDLPVCENAIRAAVQKAREQKIEAADLIAIKSRLKYSFAMSLDSPGRIALTLGNMINLTGDAGDVNTLYQRYDEVNADDVQRVARQYFDTARSTTVTLKPTGK
jgi:zinc protease